MSVEYDRYLKNHINRVKHYYKLLTGKELKSHDKSKFSKKIYEIYDQHFYGETSNDLMFDYAWLIHQNKEPHHWQYWVLIRDSGEIVPMRMATNYVYEMVSDWAACSKNGEDLKEWYNSHKDKMILHENTRILVEKLIQELSNKM